jgi:hypothetical protein
VPARFRLSASALRRGIRIAIGSLLLAAAMVLPLHREIGRRSWECVWAEDGQVYTQQAISEGGMHVLLRSQLKYLQLAPRLLVLPTPFLPVRRLALYLAVSATAVSALLAWFIYHASSDWISSRPVRLALASLLVLGPVVGYENTASVTNTIWAFAAAAPWALVSVRDRRTDVAIRAVVVFLAVTSTPLSAVFVPLGLGVALVRRTRAAWIVIGSLPAGVALQAVVMFTSHDTVRNWVNRLPVLLELIAVRVFAVFLFGVKWTTSLIGAYPQLLIVGSVVLGVAIFAVLLPRAGRRTQALAAVFLAYAVITFVTAVWGRGTTYVVLFGGTSPAAGHLRYSVVPTMMLASAVALLVAPYGAGRSRLVARVGRPLFVLHVAVLAWGGFTIGIPRSWSPDWPSSVDQYYQKNCVGADPDTPIKIPTDVLAAYSVTLPCRLLAP